MEKKRDYYEVLGVSKDAESSAIKKSLPKTRRKKIPTRTPMPAMQRQKNDSKKSQKLMQY